MNKLYQISTPTCPPCRHYRKLISELPEEITKNYVYLDATIDGDRMEELSIKHKVKFVPRFVLLDDNDDIVIDFENRGRDAIEFMVGEVALKEEASDEEE